MLVFTAAVRGYMGPLTWVPNAILALAVTVATQSRTCLAALAVGSVLQIPRRYLLIFGSIGLLGAIAVLSTGQVDAILRSIGRDGSADEAVSMAGRTDLWDFTWGLILKRPLIGYGFNSYESYAGTLWTGPAAAGVATHNNYLSVLYSTGMIGATAFLVGFLILLFRWAVVPDAARDFFVINVIISGFSEIDALSSIAIAPSLAFFLIIALDARKRLPHRSEVSVALAET
jgi:O-antigen ligase